MAAPLPLAHQEIGDGPPLLVLHGLFGSARNWTSVARRLAARHRVYALDLRNHGDSPWADDMDYRAMAGDVVAFMDAHELDRAALLGHSMGGKAAMAAALDHGPRVERLVVVDIAPVAYSAAFLSHARAMQDLDLAAIARRADADRLLQATVPEAEVRGFLVQNLVRRDDAFHWRLNLDVLAAEMDRIVGFPGDLLERSYGGPTLFVGGAQSPYIEPGHHTLIRRLFPAAEIIEIAGADHRVHADQPERFTDAVGGFLDT
jgi:pimeloyl-ACP methyl ester carboxylesterase